MSLNKEQQYKVFALQQPNRIVLDIYRILVTKNTVNQGKGLQYTFWQDNMEGLPIQMHILEVAPIVTLKILPFAGSYRQERTWKAVKAHLILGAKAAVNASYFDTSGLIGNSKRRQVLVKSPRSLVIADGKPQIMKDLAYGGACLCCRHWA